jgi:hypothetical protein
MKHIKVLLFFLLLLLASWAWCADIHDTAFKGSLAKVKELPANDPSLINAKGQPAVAIISKKCPWIPL